MERSEERRYAGLSPFELKNRLVELAKHRGARRSGAERAGQFLRPQ